MTARWDEFGGACSSARGIGEYAQDVVCLIDQLGLESPAVFGVSFGGAVALELAAEHPDRLGALIVHGVEAQFRPTIGSRIARGVLERFPLPSDSRFINQFFHLLFGSKPEPGPLLEFVIDRIWETGQTVMAERLAALESFNISDRLWSIGAPTLVLAGARDVIVPAARQRDLAGEISDARFSVVEEAGHVGFLDASGSKSFVECASTCEGPARSCSQPGLAVAGPIKRRCGGFGRQELGVHRAQSCRLGVSCVIRLAKIALDPSNRGR